MHLAVAAIQLAHATAKTWVSNELKAHGIMLAAIPKLIHGTLWTLPASHLTAKMRSAAVRAVWGPRKQLRCPEVILAVLHNPVRLDPTSAIVFRGCAADPRIFLGVQGESVAAKIRCDSSKSDAFEFLRAAMDNQACVLLHGDAALD